MLKFIFHHAISGFCLFIGLTTSTFAQGLDPSCGTLYSVGQYGPYDYRTDHDKLPIVLRAHFTPEVEMLIRGKSSTLGGDIDYTLRAIPNNHRALIAMMRLNEKSQRDPVEPAVKTVECYFQRAIHFRPDDGIVRMLYATFLNRKKRQPEALNQLGIATAYAKDNPFTHYNIGLHYFELSVFDKSLEQAHKAMALGWTQVELRDELIKAGKWVEPTTTATAPNSPASEVQPVENKK